MYVCVCAYASMCVCVCMLFFSCLLGWVGGGGGGGGNHLSRFCGILCRCFEHFFLSLYLDLEDHSYFYMDPFYFIFICLSFTLLLFAVETHLTLLSLVQLNVCLMRMCVKVCPPCI